MQIDTNPEYILVTTTENNFEDFFQEFKINYNSFAENHLIIELSDNLNIVEKNILLFLKYAESHQQNGVTFVIVTQSVDIDSFPEYLNIVPSLKEAEDVLEMENIQRDLGF